MRRAGHGHKIETAIFHRVGSIVLLEVSWLLFVHMDGNGLELVSKLSEQDNKTAELDKA
jgi:hypothetical protein